MRLITGRKIARIGMRLSEKGFGAAVFVSSGALEDKNIRYLTGLGGVQGGAVVLRDGKISLLVNSLDYDRALDCAQADEIIKAEGKDFVRTVAQRCRGAGKVGCIASGITASAAQAMKNKGVRLKDIGSLMDEERAVKEPKELAAIGKCAGMANRGIRFLEGFLEKDLPESGVAAELDHELRKLGSEGAPFETIVSSGRRSAWIHPSPAASGERIAEGPGIVDFGVSFMGYVCDVTVPFMCGRSTRTQEKMAGAVTSAAGDIEKMLRPGTSTAEIHGAFRKRLLAAGLEVKHSAGHGIGLGVHEYPSLSGRPACALRSGMALAVEPGAYVPRAGGFRIENDFIITRNGCRKLTKSHLIRL